MPTNMPIRNFNPSRIGFTCLFTQLLIFHYLRSIESIGILFTYHWHKKMLISQHFLHQKYNAGDRNRTGTGGKSRRILSPVRLPVPPRRLNGWWWIRTTEAICSRFTVCPLWPLGKPSIYQCEHAYNTRTHCKVL